MTGPSNSFYYRFPRSVVVEKSWFSGKMMTPDGGVQGVHHFLTPTGTVNGIHSDIPHKKSWVTGMSLGGVWQVWTRIAFGKWSEMALFLTVAKIPRALSPKFCPKSGQPQPPPFHRHARDRKRSFFAYLRPSATMYPPYRWRPPIGTQTSACGGPA